jgi:hypothetical protein
VSAEVTVRPSTPGELDVVGEIYAHYVRTGVATFELDPPDRAEMLLRFHTITSAGLPFLTATLDGAVAGYAYCAPWKARPAYRLTVEDSLYIAPDADDCSMPYSPIAGAWASERSSPSLSMKAVPLPLRCTVIGASSTRDG